MRLIASVVTCGMVTALSAFALDHEIVGKMINSARNIERDASLVSVSLKAKNPDPIDVRQKIDAMSEDVSKLKELVANFESTDPQMSDRDRQDWKMLKEKVQLLEIFHDQKQKLVSEDLNKNRTTIRVYADGVSKRAQKLQETALRLQRAPLS